MKMLKVHAVGLDVEIRDCRKSATIVGIIVFILGTLVVASYQVRPLTPIDSYFFEPFDPSGDKSERVKVCDAWKIPDAIVSGGRADGDCRMVPVFHPAESVMLRRTIKWNNLCDLIATDSWEPGPGNDGIAIKTEPKPVPLPRTTGLLDQARQIRIPQLTPGLWGHIAQDTASCPWMPWQKLWPVKLPPMVTEFYVK